MEKVILAYSGGLDTSVILTWLQEKDFEVIAYVADVGQEDDFEAIREKALKTGASKVYIEDLKEEFVTDYVYQAMKANVVYEGRYLLGTALARPLIAERQIEIANKEGAAYVAHGATGKGNDQVRFEQACYMLRPDIKIIAPWKDEEFLAKFEGRNDLLKYAEKHSIDIDRTSNKPPYSMDANIMHISYEGGDLEDPGEIAPEDIFLRTSTWQNAPDQAEQIKITFKEGVPIEVSNVDSGEKVTGALTIFEYLNKIGEKHAIGKIDIVENRYVGIKSRGLYETPGGTILWAAHRDMESLCLDKEVITLKDSLAIQYSQAIYNGYWFSAEGDFLNEIFTLSQKDVEGEVTLKLYKGNVMAIARTSPKSLYDTEIASMDVEGSYDQKDAAGFIKINSVRLMAYQAQKEK